MHYQEPTPEVKAYAAKASEAHHILNVALPCVAVGLAATVVSAISLAVGVAMPHSEVVQAIGHDSYLAAVGFFVPGALVGGVALNEMRDYERKHGFKERRFEETYIDFMSR